MAFFQINKQALSDFWKYKLIRRIKTFLFFAIIFSVISIVISDYVIDNSTENLIFDNVNTIVYNKVGLLLGTSKFLKNGNCNQYFSNRITATLELFNEKKIKYIVISGDNSKEDYNEPLDMKNELLNKGVPEEIIFLDYAGFRTYDSVIRMNKIFGQTSFTIISQKFHNQRAIYIAKSKNLKAIGYNAKDVNAYNGFKTKIREKFARVKVFIDLAINKNPKFLGDTIVIN